MRIVLGVTAGIAAYKSVHLARLFKEAGHQVDVIPTPASLEFVGRASWEAISGRPVTTSVFEGVDEVRHVRLGQEADLVVVAPATADLLARVRAGMASDLLTSTLLATQAPVLLVPAMHTEMWENHATAENVQTLRERGLDVLEPDVGRLTGQDSGKGRMPEPEQIYQVASSLLPTSSSGPLSGRHVVVTAGGTREPLDPVRFLGNRSSGKQGVALAEAAASAGAEVTLIAAHVDDHILPSPQHAQISTTHVETTAELQQVVHRTTGTADVLVMAAAVADFRPASYAEAKIKKTEDEQEAPVIELSRNPDILAEAVKQRGQANNGPPVIVGFAAETGSDTSDATELAQQKLNRKGCDLLVFNRVGENLVFGQADTEIQIFASAAAQDQLDDAEPQHVMGTKADAAAVIMERITALLQSSE